LGFVEKENSLGYDFIIYNDNGDTLLPTANDVPYFKTSQKQRVFTNYTILDEAGPSKKKFYVKINNIREILFKDVIDLTPANTDSLGSDPIHVTDIWLTDSLLNVEFQYHGGNNVHFINLAKVEQDDAKEPITLKFLHNANKDFPSLTINGLVSFSLKNIKKENQDSVKFQFVYTDYYGETHTVDATYNY
jgi:hypothetical protein